MPAVSHLSKLLTIIKQLIGDDYVLTTTRPKRYKHIKCLQSVTYPDKTKYRKQTIRSLTDSDSSISTLPLYMFSAITAGLNF